MKKLVFLFSIFAVSLGLKAQITITRDDMPDVGDTIRLSNAALLFGIDPSATGPDFTWNFTSLQPQSQVVEGYVSPQSTPFIYQIIFNQSVANLASPLQSLDFLPEFEVTDAYIFYKESAGNYVRAGYAAAIMGVPVPMKFDHPELLYTFPLQENSPADSSLSAYSLELPGLGFFSIERKRVNDVDGWGLLSTPFGTYNTLRMKSEVYERDSLFIDSLQIGVPVNRHYTEYQWLANGFGIPVLTITQEGPVLSARYIDNIHDLTPLSVILGPDLTLCSGDSATIQAEVEGGTPPYSYLWSTLDTTSSIRVSPADTTTFSVMVADAQNNMTFASVTVNVAEFKEVNLGADSLLICAGSSVLLDAGVGYENVTWFVNGTEKQHGQTFQVDSTGIGLNYAVIRVDYLMNGCDGSDTLVVNFYICGGINELQPVTLNVLPNPVKESFVAVQDRFSSRAEVSIVSSTGQVIRPEYAFEENGSIVVKSGNLKPGNYLLMVTEDGMRGVAKFIKQ
ncbi:MAG: T9SS type A sorting domain-containing protein [Bacteroidales bacterium]|nr:T9SS type A sorting domain-containing protein [Bacteroidales bacterium]